MDLDELLQALRELLPPNLRAGAPNDANFRCERCVACRECRFCQDCEACRSCTYCEGCRECEGCTQCRRCESCTRSSYLEECRLCSDSSYLLLCVDCNRCVHCLACVGLDDAEFCVLNRKVSRKEYFQVVRELKAELAQRAHSEGGFVAPWVDATLSSDAKSSVRPRGHTGLLPAHSSAPLAREAPRKTRDRDEEALPRERSTTSAYSREASRREVAPPRSERSATGALAVERGYERQSGRELAPPRSERSATGALAVERGYERQSGRELSSSRSERSATGAHERPTNRGVERSSERERRDERPLEWTASRREPANRRENFDDRHPARAREAERPRSASLSVPVRPFTDDRSEGRGREREEPNRLPARASRSDTPRNTYDERRADHRDHPRANPAFDERERSPIRSPSGYLRVPEASAVVDHHRTASRRPSEARGERTSSERTSSERSRAIDPRWAAAPPVPARAPLAAPAASDEDDEALEALWRGEDEPVTKERDVVQSWEDVDLDDEPQGLLNHLAPPRRDRREVDTASQIIPSGTFLTRDRSNNDIDAAPASSRERASLVRALLPPRVRRDER